MLPEVYPPVIDLLISLLTALRRIYKPVIDNIIHKMIESNLDFYLEEITESSRNTNRIKELKSRKNNQIFHVRQNSTQRFFQYRIDKITQFKLYLRCKSVKCSSRLEVILGFDSDADYDSDPETETDYDCYPDSE